MHWHLDAKAVELLRDMTGTDDELTPITLFVGDSLDDDGKTIVHGLHAYESEYPEEGVVPLVEFPPSSLVSHAALLQRVLPYLKYAAESTLSDSYKKSLDDLIEEVEAAAGVTGVSLLDEIEAIAMDSAFERGDRLQRIVSRIHAVRAGRDPHPAQLRTNGVADAERFAWLTADLPDGEQAQARRELLGRMSVMSHSAVSAEIDRHIVEGKRADFERAAKDILGVSASDMDHGNNMNIAVSDPDGVRAPSDSNQEGGC
jgi:hypothetical protein